MAHPEPDAAAPAAEPATRAGEILSADGVRRALTRMAHEVVERHGSLERLVVVGLQSGGVALANRLALELERITGSTVPEGVLDVVFYRDDLDLRPVVPESATEIPVDVEGRIVLLVDDVLFTGRTVRAALNALSDFGRAGAIELAVLVDRGHRELPIRPDYVGKNLPTALSESVTATLDGVYLTRSSA